MSISTKFLRMQIAFFKPFADDSPVSVCRAAQTALGGLMSNANKKKVFGKPESFENFSGEWIIPRSRKTDAVILYLHGGGYIAGDIEYAKGFGSILAAKNGIRVFCVAYRLAPENPFPAAVEDALASYDYLIGKGYPPSKIFLCGESAGGGLIFSLILKLKQLGRELPAGLIALSPWTDLSLSGISYEENKEADPSLSKERLANYAGMYAEGKYTDPLVSPLFGDLTGFPPSIIFVGGDEILKSDSVELHRKLIAGGSYSELTIAPGMWHVYILYGVKEAADDYRKISDFIGGSLERRQG